MSINPFATPQEALDAAIGHIRKIILNQLDAGQNKQREIERAFQWVFEYAMQTPDFFMSGAEVLENGYLADRDYLDRDKLIILWDKHRRGLQISDEAVKRYQMPKSMQIHGANVTPLKRPEPKTPSGKPPRNANG